MAETVSNAVIGGPSVQFMHSNKTQKGRIDQAPANCDSAKERQARGKLFQYFEYDCFLSCNSSNLEESVRRKKKQINEAKD